MIRRLLVLFGMAALVAGCGSTSRPTEGTLAELTTLEPDVKDVYLEDGLERAAQSYRRYLAETTENPRTPEAMRRLADLQIEQAYGLIGESQARELAAPEVARVEAPSTAPAAEIPVSGETDEEFEQRATAREDLLSAPVVDNQDLQELAGREIAGGPLEAIETYKQILEQYPNYERNDKVLYQLSRAYDEVGEPDLAMEAMNRFVVEYPYSRYADEVQFRRGEYHFVRRNFRDAESAYKRVTAMGPSSSYYELALYKMGWTLYKQQFYDEALDSFVAVLDYNHSIGYDFDQHSDEDEEHRVTDTFRVISLSFSNLGGVEVIDEYFADKGHRSYGDKIYSHLAEFYFEKLRYDDATSVYRSFVDLNPYHRKSPHFGMRVVEIFGAADFPLLVVEAKKDFSTRYALSSDYWNYHDVDESTEVTDFLKTNLGDLAGHYHALYQAPDLVDERPENFVEAQRWYRQLLLSFADDAATPEFHYRYADLLLENQNFGEAAVAYERTAYDYQPHEQSADAGYAAVFAWRQELELATGSRKRDVTDLTIESSLRFSEAFQAHAQAPNVLGAAADDLYKLEDFPRAIHSARTLLARYPGSDEALRRGAWSVVAHASLDIAEYQDAEIAYSSVLELTAEDDESRPDVIDGLAASIYKQAEQANMLEDYRAAADHFLRIKEAAPTSEIRSSAEYDAAAALMKLEDWDEASEVLVEFRESHPENELATEATKQLAHVYRESGDFVSSAREHERIAIEETDPEISREALLTAGELYDVATAMDDAIRVFEQYVTTYPRPIDYAMETRTRLAQIFKDQSDYMRYYAELEALVELDATAGGDRTDRSRFLASSAALVLAERHYANFTELELTLPFEESLAEKQARMDRTLAGMESLVEYQVAAVTSAATFYIAETYREFGRSLMESERPAGMSQAELNEYELVLEEQAWPYEEQAISVHEANFELLAGGIYNDWVQQSLDELSVLMPGRYAKSESSEGFVDSIDQYAYRMPIAPLLEPNPTVVGQVSEDAK